MEIRSKKPTQERPTVSSQPPLAAEGERGLTSKRKKLLEETMCRHDKALQMLANM